MTPPNELDALRRGLVVDMRAWNGRSYEPFLRAAEAARHLHYTGTIIWLLTADQHQRMHALTVPPFTHVAGHPLAPIRPTRPA